MPTLEEFNAYVAALTHHDWYFDYSDDIRVWRAGKTAHTALEQTAKEHNEYQEAFNAWSAHVYQNMSSIDLNDRIQGIRGQLATPMAV